MEIEVALDDGEDYSQAQDKIFELFEKLGVTDGFERTSYMELLENLNTN
jgi:adenylate cyclase class 2